MSSTPEIFQCCKVIMINMINSLSRFMSHIYLASLLSSSDSLLCLLTARVLMERCGVGQHPALVRITPYSVSHLPGLGRLFSSAFICSYSLQWIVGGVSGRHGAHAVAHVTWASDAAIGQEPIQRQRLVAVPARASASDWTHAALHLVSVQWSHDNTTKEFLPLRVEHRPIT